jgi:hypothetical protein
MESVQPNVRDDIVAFDAMRSELEAAHLGKWALFYRREFIGVFDNFDDAAKEAVTRFGKGPYLIRRIGSHSVTLPASVMYGPFSTIDTLRI